MISRSYSYWFLLFLILLGGGAESAGSFGPLDFSILFGSPDSFGFSDD